MSYVQPVTLIVPSDTFVTPSLSRAEDFQEEAAFARGPIARLFGHAAQEVPMATLKVNLERAYGEVAELLEVTKTSALAGYRLASVDISLAVSAEGSIGVATAGVQASMTFSFEPDGSPSK
jgi:hypothetical protein